MTKLEILQADYNTLSRTVVPPKRKDVSIKTQGRFTPNALAFETKRPSVFRAFPEGPPEALLRPYFFGSSFLAGSSVFTGAERISR